jgi:hypothetical protein
MIRSVVLGRGALDGVAYTTKEKCHSKEAHVFGLC